MKVLLWIIALCNRKWQKQLDTLVMESEIEPLPPMNVNEKIYLMRDEIEQPTHLAHTFQARARRKKYTPNPKPSTKEEALRETIGKEFKLMAKGR